MRHGKKFNHLGRTASHRKLMLANMASSLILNKRIQTTVAKAKALRVFVEPILTKAKEDTMHNRRVSFSYLKNKYAVKELFGAVAERIADRNGGYCRIIRLGVRKGDNAEIAIMELVDFNNVYTSAKEAKKKGSGRRRRRKPQAKTTPEALTEAVEEVSAEPIETEASQKTETSKEAEKPTEKTKSDTKKEMKTEAKKEEKPQAEMPPKKEVPKEAKKTAEKPKSTTKRETKPQGEGKKTAPKKENPSKDGSKSKDKE